MEYVAFVAATNLLLTLFLSDENFSGAARLRKETVRLPAGSLGPDFAQHVEHLLAQRTAQLDGLLQEADGLTRQSIPQTEFVDRSLINNAGGSLSSRAHKPTMDNPTRF